MRREREGEKQSDKGIQHKDDHRQRTLASTMGLFLFFSIYTSFFSGRIKRYRLRKKRDMMMIIIIIIIWAYGGTYVSIKSTLVIARFSKVQ